MLLAEPLVSNVKPVPKTFGRREPGGGEGVVPESSDARKSTTGATVHDVNPSQGAGYNVHSRLSRELSLIHI